ncbi:hypothetical protein M9H77_07823 [Catharanthus roseus]|uniref:Uncharacterized protein n=1 Tax=Catharanthus roseus TaxID=4058 RepID=A0ACC0BWF9_CATRO|nr:hypothetical protein M9H77_07823 [Catharanthus roseus]
MITNGDMVTFLLILDLMRHNSYDCYEGTRFGTRNDVRNGGNYVNMHERFHKRKAWEQKIESLFYSYCLREEEKFQLVLKYLPYEVKVWWDSKCENRRRMGAQPIKTWNLMKQSLRNRFGVGNHEEQRQGQPKVKFIELLMVEESPKIKELSEDKIIESLKIYVVKETSKEEPCCIMNEKSIGIKEKERIESEYLECSTEKESELEKSERIKENECFIEKQESEKEEQREKEIVILEKSKEVNFYANETNPFFASESLCVQNFEDPSKGEDGKLTYKIHKYYDNVSNYVPCVLGIKDQGRNMEKELGAIFEELPISLSLNPSLMYYYVSLVELKLFLESYLSHVSIYGDFYAISFGSCLFLVVPYVSKCLSSHASLEDSLLHSSSMFDPSCYDFEVMNNASIKSRVVGFGLDGVLFDILHIGI